GRRPLLSAPPRTPCRPVRRTLPATVAPTPADPKVIVWKVAVDTRRLAGDVGDAIRAISSVASGAPAGRTRRARAAAAAAPRAETPSPTPRMQAYVTLKGHCIWRRSALPRSDASTGQPASGALVYLDGQAFARPGVQADNTTPRIDLVFPSGHGAKASDFESWFGPQRQQPAPSPLQVTTVRFLNANGSPSSA